MIIPTEKEAVTQSSNRIKKTHHLDLMNNLGA